ncbi:carboxylesterase [Planotetraspora thailandica]|uniref:Carboxylesterase n=1 Tax=Planotetraspora thailandica TaxID=487172 RepID=A0A8J3Y0W1_9ACTN|nr:alpha/beta hydrolase [Planotetraspora thailandica]GII58706.1 carboxylesterase [Planotetraspora thailandica]
MTRSSGEPSGEYVAAYDAVMAQWPVSVEPVDVPSPYGTTHVNVCGPRDSRPLVLLHGGGATSAVWFANVGRLSLAHRVYAVDVIGSPGRSVADGRPLADVAGLMDWLDTLLGALGFGDVDLCGHSYGGWLALTYALHAPGRVRRLALVDPTNCFAGMGARYRLRSVPVVARPSAERVRALIRWETGGMPVDPAWLRLMCLGAEFPGAKVVMPRRPAPGRLRASAVPTLLLLAEKSRSHDIHTVAANARRVMPHVLTAVLPGVSHHTVPTEHPEHLNQGLAEFLG